MNYLLRITVRYGDKKACSFKSWGFKTYEEACKKMVEELEKLNRQIMVTDLTKVIGYTIEVREWVTGNAYKKIAWINYDLAL